MPLKIPGFGAAPQFRRVLSGEATYAGLQAGTLPKNSNWPDYDGGYGGTGDWPIWDVFLFDKAGRNARLFGCPAQKKGQIKTLTTLDGKKYNGYRSYSCNGLGYMSPLANEKEAVMALNWSNSLSNISPDTFIFSEISDINNKFGDKSGDFIDKIGYFYKPNHSNLTANFCFMDGHAENIKPTTDPRTRDDTAGAWTAVSGD